MSSGYMNKILRVDLTKGEVKEEPYPDELKDKYLGGTGAGAKIIYDEVPPDADAFDPENIVCIFTGPYTGTGAPTSGRYGVAAKSPLTGGFAGSEAGGYFGAELKRAGWDLIIFEGMSPRPVYLAIKDDQVELKPADQLWGKGSYDVVEAIREEMGDRLVRTSQCGPAGENKVLVANVIHDATRAAGRTGLGAVMGAKNLKAVAVRGSLRPPTANQERVTEMGRWFRDNFQETGSGIFSTLGTCRMVRVNNGAGGLPTRNFQQGTFDTYEKLSAETITETITVARDTCFGCPVRCKWVVEVDDETYPVDRKYGGPEYETLGAMGSVCGIDDLKIVAYANQLCNANGLDTIGAGMAIAFAMECFERGLIGLEDTDGVELRFGNGEALITMLRKMIAREGFGDVLANGSKRAAEKIGGAAMDYTVQIKGQDVAMHDPRVKYGHGLGIALSPTGADHMHSVHDSGYQTDGGIADLKPLGVLEPLSWDDLSTAKVQMVRRAMMWRVMYNLTGICFFHFWTPEQVSELLGAITGWNTSVMEIWTAGERAYNMARAFNAREGSGPDDDLLPERLYEELPDGPKAGIVYSRETWLAARDKFYELAGWDLDTAAPTRAKLEDLDVAWVADLLDEAGA